MPIVISLGPHHSFPLADVPRFLTSGSIRATLQQAILDQPIFQSRWRWNLNRSLVVLRFRGGRKVPPPFQRMQSDDLLAVVFPGAAACQENVTGPIEVPDTPLPRQAVHDCLTEALDCDGLIELWRRVEAGRGALPLRRLHRAVAARPRDPQRRALRVPRRRRGHRPALAHRAAAPGPAAGDPGDGPGHPGGDRPGPGGDRAGPHHARRAPRPPEHAPAEPVPAGVGRAPRCPRRPAAGWRRSPATTARRGGTPSRRRLRSERWSRAWTSTAPPPSRRRPRCCAATWRWPPR